MNTQGMLALLAPWLRARCRVRGKVPVGYNAVVYWMRVAVRDHDNPALDVALALATQLGLPFTIVHALSERYPYASDRHHTFVLEGARDVAQAFRSRGIPYAFHLECEGARAPILRMLADQGCLIVTDLMPTAPLQSWTERLAKHALVVEVDASCILPMPTGLQAAPTRAFEFRKQAAPHTAELLANGYPLAPSMVCPLTPLATLPFEPVQLQQQPIADLVAACAIDHGVGPVPDSPGGMHAGYARWSTYVATQLHSYAATRNDPLADSTSRMSPYLHYGHVSPFRLAHELTLLVRSNAGAEKLLDELLVWRELAWHHAYHEPTHSTLSGIPAWALSTLAQHQDDARPSLPSYDQMARGNTDDELWNACQRSLLAHGELHNNVRMTWGKKILEWTATAEAAFHTLVDLNHRYALDGRDPASYGGIRWCLGAFDRPFTPERPIVGTVRPRPTEQHRNRLDMGAYAAWVGRAPFARQPRVAVIGSGIAGLAAARVLQDHNIDAQVFDKGSRPGGRLVSRQLLGMPFDYGAQYFTARSERFALLSRALIDEGVLAIWQPRQRQLDAAGVSPSESQREPQDWLVAPQGFSAFAARLALGLNVQQLKQVLRIERAKDEWTIRFTDGSTAQFDEVLVTVPGPQQGALVEHAPSVGTYVPCWSLTLGFHGTVALPFDAARTLPGHLPVPSAVAQPPRVPHAGPLAWVCRESSKPGRYKPDVDVWTLHASEAFSVAQLESETSDVQALMQQAFAALCAQYQVDAPVAIDSHLHKWRYARTQKTHGLNFANMDGIGFGGDALGGPRVESAYLSGVAMAGELLRRLAAEGAGARHA